MGKIKAPQRQCRICGRKKRSWMKTIICCDLPMGAPPIDEVKMAVDGPEESS